jgi:hypothetical protein
VRLALTREFFKDNKFLRELNVEVGAAYHIVRYFDDHADVASGLTDMEFTVGGSLWSMQDWSNYSQEPLRVWSEVGASVIYSRATIELARQDSLRIQGTTLAGLNLLNQFEPYILVATKWDPVAQTDWDNNLRLGAGLRVPIWSPRAETFDRIASMLVRLDGNWQRTIAYWANAAYVPTFRPLDDVQVSLNVWGGWGSIRPAVNQTPAFGSR